MKKYKYIILALVCVCITSCLDGCGPAGGTSGEPLVKVDGSAFDCTPQELIDLINEGAGQNEDVFPLPDYDGSILDKKICGAGLTVHYRANDAGYLEYLEIYWASGSEKKIMTSAAQFQ